MVVSLILYNVLEGGMVLLLCIGALVVKLSEVSVDPE